MSLLFTNSSFAGDLTLGYAKPAERWSESLLMGNGRIGACVWGGIDREVINLNEDSLWTGEPGYEINPKALPALPEVRRLLLAGENAQAGRTRNELSRPLLAHQDLPDGLPSW